MVRKIPRRLLLGLGLLIGMCLTISLYHFKGKILHVESPFLHRRFHENDYDSAFQDFNGLRRSSIYTSIDNAIPTFDARAKNLSRLRNTFNMSTDLGFEIGHDNLTNKDKYFIYRCDESTLSFCGGWIDRIKGTTAAYVIANLTGRTFKMEVLLKSCDLHRYIVPNHVNWHLPVSFHKNVMENTKISVMRKIDDKGFINSVDFNFTKMPGMESKFVYYKGNREYFTKFQTLRQYHEALAWMKNLTYGEIVNALYRRLFKPSPYLQNKTKSFLATNLLPHEKLVCAHMRTGPNPTIPRDVKMYKITERGMRNTLNFLEGMTKNNESKIFFMSDSEGLISQMKNLPFGSKVFISPGKIVHVDQSRGLSAEENCEGLEKIIFEHYVLLHCDVLLISKSGIGVHAAFVRNTDDGLYCLHDSGFLASCKRNDIVDIYRLVL